jgi:hypothetical protein
MRIKYNVTHIMFIMFEVMCVTLYLILMYKTPPVSQYIIYYKKNEILTL